MQNVNFLVLIIWQEFSLQAIMLNIVDCLKISNSAENHQAVNN